MCRQTSPPLPLQSPSPLTHVRPPPPHLLQVFKQSLPPSVCDPSSLGRIRSCTLLPLASAAVVCRQYGRSPASMAWLRAFSQPVPDAWLLYEEQEANAANLQVDLVLQDKLERLEAEQHFEAEELSFAVRAPSTRASSSLPKGVPHLKTGGGVRWRTGGAHPDVHLLRRRCRRGANEDLHPLTRALHPQARARRVFSLSHKHFRGASAGRRRAVRLGGSGQDRAAALLRCESPPHCARSIAPDGRATLHLHPSRPARQATCIISAACPPGSCSICRS